MYHKIDGTKRYDAEDLDLVMLMYNLIECSSNNSETAGSLQIYSKDEAIDFNADIANINNFKSFTYEAKVLENSEVDGANGILKNATIAVTLKFEISFEMPLINWTKYCVLFPAGEDNVNNRDSDNIIFTIKGTKLYVLVVTLSARDNQKVSKTFSKGFQRSVYWNEY